MPQKPIGKTMRAAATSTFTVGIILCGAVSSAQTLDSSEYVVHPPPGIARFALRDVTVVDLFEEQRRHDMVVVIDGHRIVLVAREVEADVSDDIRSVDASGKYLIPGLWDMHVHGQADWTESGPLLVSYGVTGVREAWAPNWNSTIRDEIASGELLAPRIVAAGNMIDGPIPLQGERVLAADSPQAARQLVDSLAKKGVPFIKLYHAMPRETYFAIVDRADRHGIPFAGHVPPTVSVAEASDAGQRSIEHFFGILPACTRNESEHLKNRRDVYYRPEQGAAKLVRDFDLRTCQRLAAQLAANQTWQVPTLIAISAWYRLPEEPFGPRPLQVTPWEADYWAQTRKTVEGYDDEQRAALDALWERILEVIALFHEAGVPILAGSDPPNEPAYFGIGLHDEMQLLTEAGFTPAQALRAATTEPARFFHASDSLGRIEPGMLADLVLLDEDPLQDIRNSRTIAAVILNGRLIDRQEIDAMQTRVFEAIHTRALSLLVSESGVPTLEIRTWPEVDLSVDELSRYQGTYQEGNIRTRIWIEKSRLRYESSLGHLNLVPMGEHTFAVGRYEEDTLVEIFWPDETYVFYFQDGVVAGFRTIKKDGTAVFDAPRVRVE